jgi:hypothetical protein
VKYLSKLEPPSPSSWIVIIYSKATGPTLNLPLSVSGYKLKKPQQDVLRLSVVPAGIEPAFNV